MVRRPKGYVGLHHETIGSDLLAVRRSLEQLIAAQATPRLPAQILGAAELARLDQVSAGGWYPIAWLLDMMERIDERLGHFALLKMGRALFKLSHEERVLAQARSGRDIVNGIDAMYHAANRGERIGGWEVLSFTATRAELDNTTPHHCAMEEGLLTQALSAVGAPSVVTQEACFREGAPSCRFVILPSVTGKSWTGDGG
jgi:hypothetical protein